MSRLARDGTAEPVSRDQILRHARGQGNIIFPCSPTTSRIGNLTRLIHALLYVMTIHTCTYIHAYVHTIACTVVYTVVKQSVLVDYCCFCFHLTSGASTAVVGPYIIPRNRRRLLSTLREEFVEKKYQVFDIIGPLIILSQVNLSSPVER